MLYAIDETRFLRFARNDKVHFAKSVYFAEEVSSPE